MFQSLFFLIAVFCMGFLPMLQAKENTPKVALLFLTREDLNFPDLWKNELQACAHLYNIYVHSKKPMQHPFFKPYRISKIVPTSWARHVKAWQALLQEALKNPENVKFVFVTESCMPLYRLSTIYRVLTQDPFSYMEYKRPWWAGTERTVREIDPKHFYGSWEFVVLNRQHAQLIANDRTIIEIVARYPLDIESYFATFFSLQNCLTEFVNRTYTYMNWEHLNKGGAHPHEFEHYNPLSEQLIKEAYEQGCLFLRKVAKTFPEEVWLSYMQNSELKPLD